MPPKEDALLDGFSGSLKATVAFSTKDEDLAVGQWGVSQQATFSIDGHMNRREVANELRGRLLGSAIYNVESRGPDVPEKFDLVLVTGFPSPDAPVGGPVPRPPDAKGGTR